MAPKDIAKTAIITPFGLYEYLRMPFGLKSAAQTFQRLMDTVFQNVSCVFVNFYYILIAITTVKQHVCDMTVCRRLNDYGLTIRLEKCMFGVKSINFLGHQIIGEELIPLPSKLHAITHHPKQHNVRALQELPGMINFYHLFIPKAATKLYTLYCALKGKIHNQCLVWYSDMTNAYNSAITSLANAIFLAHQRSDVSIAMTSDASDSGIGAVFEQFIEDAWQPLAFSASNSVNRNASTVHLTENC